MVPCRVQLLDGTDYEVDVEVSFIPIVLTVNLNYSVRFDSTQLNSTRLNIVWLFESSCDSDLRASEDMLATLTQLNGS